ncbi:MAG: DNA-processing protein DprA, partial [Oscillospiraceae bacterium]|nr:DNA-processing protein DprA [Oscillospiraceae bacterium]
ELHVNRLSLDKGEVDIDGRIDSILYSEVIRTPEKSGSLITAELALEQGRTVFCIPPADIFDNRYAGVVKYLRDGAVPVFSYLDIVNEYYHSYTHKLVTSVLFESSQSTADSVIFGEKAASEEAAGGGMYKEKSKDTVPKNKENRKTEAEDKSEDVKQAEPVNRDFSSLDGLELKIAVLLSQEHQMHIDAIVERLDADESEVASAVTMLAIEGYITRFSGQCYGIL